MIYSLQIGNIQEYIDENGHVFKSAMIKNIYKNKLSVHKTGVNDDNISDKKNHGGIEKAVFANAFKNYKIWNNFLGKNLNIGDMGENITIKDLDERNVYIGDIHRIGSAVLQVSQPRKPCAKIYKIYKNKNFTNFIFSSGLSGWYYRVLKEGEFNINDSIDIECVENTKLSVMELNKLFYAPKINIKLFDKLKALTTIEKRWIETIEKRLNHSYDNSYMSEL